MVFLACPVVFIFVTEVQKPKYMKESAFVIAFIVVHNASDECVSVSTVNCIMSQYFTIPSDKGRNTSESSVTKQCPAVYILSL